MYANLHRAYKPLTATAQSNHTPPVGRELKFSYLKSNSKSQGSCDSFPREWDNVII
jgi:hypothetical protein